MAAIGDRARGRLKHGKFCETRWPLRIDSSERMPVLNTREVKMIRKRIARGENSVAVAERYGITTGHVWNIVAYRVHKEID